MGQAVVRSFTDSHIRKDMPDRAFPGSHLLRVAGPQRADEGRVFLWCPRPFPLGAVVTSATLRVHTRDARSAAAVMRLHRVADQFTVSEVSWTRQPGVVSGWTEVTRASSPEGALWEFDVKAHMQAIAAGQAWWGFRLITPTDALLRIFSADHTGNLQPTLEVEWSDQPSKPTQLAPSANRAVTKDKPTLSYVFTDVSGDTSLAASRVQIHTEPITTGTPLWSGEVPGPDPVIDLAATSAPSIPLNATRWWRVSARDGAGLDSVWSDWAQFRRVAMPTLTVTSPANGSVVENPEPTVSWSVAGGTQESYQVLVWDRDRTVRYFTSGRVSSSSTRAVGLPAGVLSRDDAKYRIEVRIWDTVPRAPQPDEWDFVERSVEVTFDRDGSLTPVTLGLVPTPDQVGMELTWTRDVDPGRWAILRDGEIVTVVESGPYVAGEWSLPLNDFTVFTDDTALYSDQGWRWVDWTADPRRNHTWEVAPIVNGVAGKGTPVTGRLEPVGVWLVRPQTGERVMVTNDDVPSGWGMVEQSTSHLPLGARKPVLITQGMGGYQGSTRGELVDTRTWGPGGGVVTAQEARDTFLSLKERQGQTHRLVLADYNLPVTTWNMTVAPAPAGPHLRYAVGWDWAQVDEFDYTPRYL